MKEKLLKAKNTPLFHRLYAAVCIVILAYYPLVNMTDWDSRGNYLFLLQIAAVVLGLMYCLSLEKKAPVECHILTAVFLWTLLSRTVIGDLSAGWKGTILYALCAVPLFRAGSLLDREETRKLLDIATAVLCGILFLWAFCGLLILLTGMGYLPIIHKNIAMQLDTDHGGVLRYLTFFGLHRNDTAPWFMVALWLMAYQWIRCKQKLWRIPMAVAGYLFYLSIAVQHCRSVIFATAGGFAMLAFLAVQSWQKERKALTRWAIALMAALLALGISYMGFSLSEKLLNQVCDVTNQAYADWRGYTLPSTETDSSDGTLSDGRDTLKDLKSMTGRKTVWKAVLKTRSQDPSLAIWGDTENEIIPNMIARGAMKHMHNHTHNTLFQVFAVLGLPGLLLYLALLGVMAWRMLRLFFSTAPLAVKCLTVPIATLAVYGVTEPLMSPLTAFPSLCFLLIAGIASQWLVSAEK